MTKKTINLCNSLFLTKKSSHAYTNLNQVHELNKMDKVDRISVNFFCLNSMQITIRRSIYCILDNAFYSIIRFLATAKAPPKRHHLTEPIYHASIYTACVIYEYLKSISSLQYSIYISSSLWLRSPVWHLVG